MALVHSVNGVILDYGGVLVHHQTDEDQGRMAERAGLDKNLFTELYWSNRLEYDKDQISCDEYWESLAQSAGTTFDEKTIEELVELDTLSWMQFDEVMWDWIAQLRSAGKRVAMLSNMPRELGEALKARTQRLSSFDHVTLSYEVRSAKPEPAIYERCLEGLGVPGEEALFLDDRIANVQGAELFGMRAVQFTSRDDTLLLLST
ncbi:MAG: HAD family phosphatase [Acidobacteriaceae bacterium]|nr:HAD family phosphatase [Acidobacteriaceae bacterium]MBV9404220.1 HAD family phosphatase [Acidobacteriaceae bacterium]